MNVRQTFLLDLDAVEPMVVGGLSLRYLQSTNFGPFARSVHVLTWLSRRRNVSWVGRRPMTSSFSSDDWFKLVHSLPLFTNNSTVDSLMNSANESYPLKGAFHALTITVTTGSLCQHSFNKRLWLLGSIFCIFNIKFYFISPTFDF